MKVKGAKLSEIVKRPEIQVSDVLGDGTTFSETATTLVEEDIKYAGYIERQKAQIEQAEKYDQVKLPEDVDYQSIEHLSMETREKLNRIRPSNLGQAARIGGVRPADVSVLMVWLETRRKRSQKVLTAADA